MRARNLPAKTITGYTESVRQLAAHAEKAGRDPPWEAIELDDLRALLKACEGRGFNELLTTTESATSRAGRAPT